MSREFGSIVSVETEGWVFGRLGGGVRRGIDEEFEGTCNCARILALRRGGRAEVGVDDEIVNN